MCACGLRRSDSVVMLIAFGSGAASSGNLDRLQKRRSWMRACPPGIEFKQKRGSEVANRGSS
eukprot:15479569-Alexandrium_andersonii.AAC.1